MNIKTILSKPFLVVWYRFIQLIKLKFYYKLKFWNKIEYKISKKVNGSQNCWKQKSLLFSETNNISDNLIYNKLDDLSLNSTKAILNGKISIFDVEYNLTSPFQWNIDWRFNYKWENTYFKNYSFYETKKTIDYDVKFPWELSRLSFLIPIARNYLNHNKKDHIDYLFDVLYDWKEKNPIAHSVNWYPMEVSVRIINLIQLREILLVSSNSEKTVNLLNEILLLHGIFLWRNIEYTDVRGNHYSANLTALLLLGQVYKGFYSEANQWYGYALKKTEKEFHLQFIDDGVNFEKSIPYHRLVVEFYLISFLVIRRSGKKIKPKTLEKFKKACLFIKDYTKPHNNTPIIGDNDSASVFQNDNITLNNHTNILQLASLFFNDNTLNISQKVHLSAVEIFGIEKATQLQFNKQTNLEYHHYSKGGFVIVKNDKNYVIIDVGEVGMKGRGGHGHNDLFSFELMCNDKDFIVDPGMYTYTGNLNLKNKMKSTAYHNVLQIDNEEIAPLIGNWGISNIAEPKNVVVTKDDENITIKGKHEGYKRLYDPVEHRRDFEINTKTFTILCTDFICCKTKHHVNRYLHFSENVELALNNNHIIAKQEGSKYLITYDDASTSTISEYSLSYNYGSKITSRKIIINTKIETSSELFFSIKKLTENE